MSAPRTRGPRLRFLCPSTENNIENSQRIQFVLSFSGGGLFGVLVYARVRAAILKMAKACECCSSGRPTNSPHATYHSAPCCVNNTTVLLTNIPEILSMPCAITRLMSCLCFHRAKLKPTEPKGPGQLNAAGRAKRVEKLRLPYAMAQRIPKAYIHIYIYMVPPSYTHLLSCFTGIYSVYIYIVITTIHHYMLQMMRVLERNARSRVFSLRHWTPRPLHVDNSG